MFKTVYHKVLKKYDSLKVFCFLHFWSCQDDISAERLRIQHQSRP